MPITEPVIIIGAPRSGTSLMQQILRGHGAFASVAKESQAIWGPYTDPAGNGWAGEGPASGTIDPAAVAAIRQAFDESVLPAKVWRWWERVAVLRSGAPPAVRRAFDAAYAGATGVLRAARRGRAGRPSVRRLADKSVHAGLWLDLVDQVFPDARYVYMQRDGRDTVASMLRGWLDPHRFFTYRPPVPLEIPGYPHTEWNFPLPPGWREYVAEPLERVVAFQWRAIHEAIQVHFAVPERAGRVLPVKLEALAARPEAELRRISDFVGVDWNRYLARSASRLPVVNAGGAVAADDPVAAMVERVRPEIAAMQARLGYTE